MIQSIGDQHLPSVAIRWSENRETKTSRNDPTTWENHGLDNLRVSWGQISCLQKCIFLFHRFYITFSLTPASWTWWFCPLLKCHINNMYIYNNLIRKRNNVCKTILLARLDCFMSYNARRIHKNGDSKNQANLWVWVFQMSTLKLVFAVGLWREWRKKMLWKDG